MNDSEPRYDDASMTSADTGTNRVSPLPDPDRNEDGELHILVIGTNTSIQDGSEPFSPDQIAIQLREILENDPAVTAVINVVAEDIFRSEELVTGYGQGGDEYTWPYFCHSLAQYYFWPEERAARLARLSGEGESQWDHVIIAADPHIVSTQPGFFALGANLIAQAVSEGGAQPALLAIWPRVDDESISAQITDNVHRAGRGARVHLPVIPAGTAWAGLSPALRDDDRTHPTPNGAFIAAASIYSQLFGRSASASSYDYNDQLAEAALSAVDEQREEAVRPGNNANLSPFDSANISNRALRFNHTGTSSERGILRGLRWVLERARVSLERDGDPPIDFNYGRANTEFEPNKRYRIAPDEFNFSLGFPMQDHSNHGNITMLYGLDKRRSDTENGTDLGVARKMTRDGELPHARAIPIRTLLANMKDAIPNQSAYADGWHMNHDLDKATGAFMYTMLTGHCALGDEPDDPSSDAWRSWMAHKIGYETAWTMATMSGIAPCFRVLPEAANANTITDAGTQLNVSFANPPSANVVVRLSSDNDSAVVIEPTELVFTPENHREPQTVRLTSGSAPSMGEQVTITATTESEDTGFDGLQDNWTYGVAQ